MRQLHKVSPHETFIASGAYRYWCDDTELAVIEQFTIHQLDQRVWLYRVDEDGRAEDGLSILSEGLVNEQRQFERFNVQSHSTTDETIQRFKADYSFYADYVQIGQIIDKQAHEYREFSLIDHCQTYIKQTVYMGLLIHHIHQQGGSAHVFVPPLIASDQTQLQKIVVVERESQVLEIGRKQIHTRQFQIADDVFYWLDEHLIPIRRTYIHDGHHYRAQIYNYAHR